MRPGHLPDRHATGAVVRADGRPSREEWIRLGGRQPFAMQAFRKALWLPVWVFWAFHSAWQLLRLAVAAEMV